MPKLDTRLEEAVAAPQSSAKDIDALARARHALEKVWASVAGENREQPPAAVQVVVKLPDWAPQPRRGHGLPGSVFPLTSTGRQPVRRRIVREESNLSRTSRQRCACRPQ